MAAVEATAVADDPRLVRAVAIARELRAKLDAHLQQVHEPLAIVGVGCRLPGGVGSPAEFWQLLASGTDAVTEPPARWGDVTLPGALSDGGFLSDVESFDAGFFGISPREARQVDPQQRLFLEVAWHALEDAGCTRDGLRGSATGVFVGANATDHLQRTLAVPAAIDMHTVVGNANSMIANRLSYALDLRGPSIVVDTACSSSMVALHLAAQSLRLGDCDRAVVGGVNLILSQPAALAHATGLPVAAHGRCRTFDAAASGYVRAEAVVALVLVRLSDALAAGDPVWAVLHGSAVNQDGTTNGIAAPNGLAQRRVIERALSSARIRPEQVSLIEAHGTGTELGDPIEVEALAAVYGKPATDGGRCALGSVKTNFGHAEAAAGLTGVLKAVLAIAHRAIPPSLHFNTLNPNIELHGGRLFVVDRLTTWDVPDEQRYAAVSAFGAGGTNAHVLLGPAPAPADSAETSAPADSAETSAADPAQASAAGPAETSAAGPQPLAISAPTEAGLRRMAERYRDFLVEEADRTPFADICWSAWHRRTGHDRRLLVLAETAGHAADRLDGWLAGTPSPYVRQGRCSPPLRRGTVFVFPGQGAQRRGMGSSLLRHSAAYRQAVTEADEHFQRWLGRSVLAEIDGLAEHTGIDLVQPALFLVAIGLAAELREHGIVPDAVLGHSMGEVAAAYVAGILSLEDATRVIGLRSRLLRRISGRGAMLVVGLDQQAAEQVVASRSSLVSVAVVNAPRSTVLSGDQAELELIAAELRERNVFVRPVQVDVASHSPQVDPLMADLASELAGLQPRPGSVPLISSVTGERIDGRTMTTGYWLRNLREPVLFWPATQQLLDQGHDVFIELSPHPTLTTAVEQAMEVRAARGIVIDCLHRDRDDRLAGLAVAAALHSAGLPADRLAAGWHGQRPVRLPDYAFERTSFPLPAAQPGLELAVAAAAEPAPTDPDAAQQLAQLPPDRRAAAIRDGVSAAVAAELQCDIEDIDPDAGFFQIGMDSRLATAARLRIDALIGRALAPTALFEYPTVRQLSEHVESLLATVPAGESPVRQGAAGESPVQSPAGEAATSEGPAGEGPVGKRPVAAQPALGRPPAAGPPADAEADLAELASQDLLQLLAEELRLSEPPKGSLPV